jgi:perosamine synthetase
MINISCPIIGDEEKQAVLQVLDSGFIAQGPKVKAFEEAFAAMCGVKYAIATSSGTTALHLALLAHGIGEGDEVITSPFTFIASANSVLFCGARPAFVDIDPLTYNLDAAQIEAKITPRTRAILPIHIFGLCSDMDAIQALAGKHNLVVVEDACQSHGAEFHGRKAGSFGTGAFSLYATKNMTTGEGGMITTNDAAIDEKCRVLRQHGMRRRYYHDELGYNFRMTDIQAALGIAQLQKLERFNEARIRNASYLSAHIHTVKTPVVPDGYRHVFHQYTVRVEAEKRDALLAHLHDRGIGTGVFYPVPVHKQSFYQSELGYDDHLIEAESAAGEVLSLPVHPSLSEADLAAIVKAVNEF